ncbi:hypothetical protein AB0M10_15725 [Streptomyces sp. NPDC051840]|uniref:hypothetical protein n=1 Tax=Streptomyces sp. NPDC051840 TaxID=3154752 RepID=UPI00343AE8A7
MTMSDVAAQMLSILVSAAGLVIFRLIAKYLPEDPPPVPRANDAELPPDPSRERPT